MEDISIVFEMNEKSYCRSRCQLLMNDDCDDDDDDDVDGDVDEMFD